MDEDETRTFTVYRHHEGTTYHGALTTIKANDSDIALRVLRQEIEANAGRWRAFDPNEILVLRSDNADVVHLVRVNVAAKVERVQRVA